jgi:hypothetical protein
MKTIGTIDRTQRWWSVAVLLLVVLQPGLTSGQSWPSELWHDGRIVLVAGDTLRGQIKYDLQQDLIQYNKGERTEAYSARKVLFFEIFDNSVRKYRQFFALPFSTGTGYQTPIFFELLEEGELTLLSREAIEYRTYNSPYYIGSYSRQVLVNKYFFLNNKGEIKEFVGNKSDLLQMMGKKSKDVERFIKTNKLRYEEKYDFARIVGYYNSL